MTHQRSTLRPAALITALCAALAACAVNISGILKDANGDPLIAATVKLINPTDSSMVAGVITDADGHYTLTGISPGTYLLQADYLGLVPVSSPIEVDSVNLSVEPIILAEASEMLSEVSVVAVKTPIKVMTDTVEYNAGSYRTQPNAVVEDVLKRLPGVEVGSDGKITANGKSVTKILVDGKEFFSDDPTVASRSLPADMVDKVQVVDRKSDLARITGVDDGEDETVINLTVKKGMKNGWFGTAEAGYGTDSRYAVSFNVNRFWNDNQFTFLGNANNINQMGFTDGNGQRFRRYGGDNGINTTQSLGFNFNVGNAEIFRVGGNVLYSRNDRKGNSLQNRQYLFPDSTSYSYTGRRSRDRGNNIRGDFRLQWNPDSANTLEFRPRFSVNINRSWSNDTTLISAGDALRSPVTHAINHDLSRGTSYEVGGELVYNHRFLNHPGRSFSVNARYNFSDITEETDAYSRTLFYLLGDSLDIYDQYSDNHTWSNQLQARLTWTEPLGDPRRGHFLTVAYRAQYRWNNADKNVYDHPVVYPDPLDPAYADMLPWINYNEEIFNADLSNRFRNNYFNQDIELGYRHVTSAYNLNIGIAAVPQMSESRDLINSARDISRRWVWNYAPFLRLRWKLDKSRSISAHYRGRSSQPSMAQLQPVADVSDPMDIIVGNPNLAPSFTHNLNLRYQDFNLDAQRSIMAILNVRMTQNSIISHTTFDSSTGGRTTTYENVNGVWQLFGMAMYSRPLPGKLFTISNHLNFNYNRNVGYNNDILNVSRSLSFGDHFTIAFRPDNIELELRPYYTFQKTWNKVQTSASDLVHTYGGTFNALWYTPVGLVLSSDLTYSATRGYTAGFDENQWMWNASISYRFLPGDAATIALKVYDLLHQKSDISRTVTAGYIDDTRYNALTRYFMLTFTYKFNTFGAGNEPRMRDNGQHRRPGAPPPGAPRP